MTGKYQNFVSAVVTTSRMMSSLLRYTGATDATSESTRLTTKLPVVMPHYIRNTQSAKLYMNTKKPLTINWDSGSS